MAFDIARAHLAKMGFEDRIRVFDVSSATVELAARALQTEEARIAKSLTFLVQDRAVMIICAGDVKVNSGKFKTVFHEKAKMLTREQVSELIGHEVGGVCPFGVKPGVAVYLDESLKRFDTVYPACGSDNSGVRLSPEELEQAAQPVGWIDVCVPMA